MIYHANHVIHCTSSSGHGGLIIQLATAVNQKANASQTQLNSHWSLLFAPAACTQCEVDEVFVASKAAQKPWARTPLWKRAEVIKRAAGLLRSNAQPIADCLVKEIAKPAKDSLSEVVRSADMMEYTAEEGVRVLGEGQLLNSDSFPGQARNKLCLVSKVRRAALS